MSIERNARRTGRLHGVATTAAVLLAVTGAAAQEAPSSAADIVLGTHVTRLPAIDFVDPFCISGAPLASFAEFATCTAGDGGLREVQFAYDDLDEMIARARGSSSAESRMVLAGLPIVPSLLIDADGRVQGYRIATEPEAEVPADPRPAAMQLAEELGLAGCNLDPPAPGSSADRTCTGEVDGRSVTLTVAMRGQPGGAVFGEIDLRVTQIDPAAAPAIAAGLADPAPDTRPRPPYANRLAAFVAGGTADCVGCNLAGMDFRRRDLTGGNFTDANLAGTIFHRANLAGATFTGADLTGANLNLADVSGATFGGAELVSAMLYRAAAAGANFTGAGLRSALLPAADLTGARFDGSGLDSADLSGARLDDASLFFATLRYANLGDASLAGADLRGATASDAILTGADLGGADLSDALFNRADLTDAVLAGANLTRSDLGDSILLRADLNAAVTEGTRFTGAMMPDGSIAP